MSSAALAKVRLDAQHVRSRALATVRRVRENHTGLMARGRAGLGGGLIGELARRDALPSVGPLNGFVVAALVGHGLAVVAPAGEPANLANSAADAAVAIAAYEAVKNRA
jgi:hypothetical protein